MSAKEKRKLSTVVSILCVMFVALIVVYIKFINNKDYVEFNMFHKCVNIDSNLKKVR